jgi:hypothetical protein
MVEALAAVMGPTAVEVLSRLERWPLFGRGEDGIAFSFRHETYRQYLAAEHLLRNLSDAQILFTAIGRHELFVLACLFALARERFQARPLPSDMTSLLGACWVWDPVGVAALLPGDDQPLHDLPFVPQDDRTDFRSILSDIMGPLDGPVFEAIANYVFGVDYRNTWWLGVLQTLQGYCLGESYRDLIANQELSFPPGSLIESLRRPELWNHLFGHEAGMARMERLNQLICKCPEPWADLFGALIRGLRDSDDAIRAGFGQRETALLDGEGDDTPTYRMIYRTVGVYDDGCFSPPPAALKHESEQEGYIPPDDLYPGPDQIPEEWERGDAQWLVYMLLNARSIAFGYVLWLLNSKDWQMPDSPFRLSRRQWNQLWRRWHVFVEDNGSRLYKDSYTDLPREPGRDAAQLAPNGFPQGSEIYGTRAVDEKPPKNLAQPPRFMPQSVHESTNPGFSGEKRACYLVERVSS